MRISDDYYHKERMTDTRKTNVNQIKNKQMHQRMKCARYDTASARKGKKTRLWNSERNTHSGEETNKKNSHTQRCDIRTIPYPLTSFYVCIYSFVYIFFIYLVSFSHLSSITIKVYSNSLLWIGFGPEKGLDLLAIGGNKLKHVRHECDGRAGCP